MKIFLSLRSIGIKYRAPLLDIILAITVAIGTVAFYQFSLSPLHYFFADDWSLLYVGEFSHLSGFLSNILPATTYGDRPMGSLFCWIVYNIVGLNNVACHSAILLVHICNVFLLFSIIKKITKSSVDAFVGSSLFSVYFAGGMCVIWFGDPADLMAGTFVLLTLFFYLKGKTRYLLLSATSYFCAMRSKEVTISLVAFLTLGEFFDCFNMEKMMRTSPIKGFQRLLSTMNKLKFHYLAFLIVFGKYFTLFYTQWKTLNNAFSRPAFALGAFVKTVSWFIWRLLYVEFSESAHLANQFLLVILCLLGFIIYKKRYLAVLCFLATVLTVVPMAIFLPDVKTQHILYVPTLFISMMAATLLHSKLRTIKTLAIFCSIFIYYQMFTSDYRKSTMASTITVTSEFKRSYDSIRKIFPKLEPHSDIYILNIPGPFNLFDYGSTMGGSFAMKIMYHDKSITTITYKTKNQVEKLYAGDKFPKAIVNYEKDGTLTLIKKDM